jgi:flagellar hook-associated protein 2
MAVDFATSLGVGSGINTTQLVSDLVNATRQPKERAINGRIATNNARISALASAKSSLDTFSTSLTEVLKRSEYSGQPVSNDPSIAAVSLIAGGTPKGLPAQLEVRQLARAQTLVSNVTLADGSAVAGTGTLTLTTATGSVDITLASPKNQLADLASAINDAKAGVTASVVLDKNGARLVLKGESGAANAFTLTAGADADADLSRFTFDGTTGGMTRSQTAQDAIIRVDNVEMNFARNEVTTAIPYLRIDLNKAAPGTTVTLATNQPTATIKDLVQEYVAAYNKLRTALNDATRPGTETTAGGALAGESSVRTMIQRLSGLNTTSLAATGPYRTLVDIGVKTNRDGTLALDEARLDKALADNPAAVTQMLNPTVQSTDNPGIAGALKKITDALTDSDDGVLTTAQGKYDKLKTALGDQLEKLDKEMSDYEEQLTKTYSAMNTRITGLKATLSYLQQQVDVWNKN